MSRILRARLRALTTFLSTMPSALSTALSTTVARHAGIAVVCMVTALLLLCLPTVAYADANSVVEGTKDLQQVITSLQRWITGIMWSVAGLFAVLGSVYRMTAGGDTEQVTAGNRAFKNALIGAALGVLAPVLLQIVKGIVGG